MIYPSDLEIKIGFDRIRAMLQSKCMCALGVRQLEEIRLHTSISKVEMLLNQTEEFRQICIQNLPFPQSNYLDLSAALKRIKTPGAYLDPEEMTDLRMSYLTILGIIRFVGKTHNDGQPVFPALHTLVSQIEAVPHLTKNIEAIVDERSHVINSASPALAEIRSRKKRLEREAEKKVTQILQYAKREGLVSDDVELSLRNGRQVIPIPASNKRKIKGVIHDQSATGQTCFLEPIEAFELNNEIHELQMEEHLEIVRILKTFADSVRPHVTQLLAAYRMLGKIDLIRAKALLAMEMRAMLPKISDKPIINWVKAYHPLLYLSHTAQNKHVEPLSMSLDDKQRILVISGPNAGGKSVCLKTCGLLQYMLQCGLLVPMESYSEAGIFQRIFIDIGDQQSLENDLSTYSSHLVNMKFFLGNASASTLFLIDEFGAGTEPRIGGALAEAILEQLNASGAIGVITTHYSNLKLMAANHKGIANASMLFDTKNMRPLFKMKTGNPGSSFAFEIARSIGLSEQILKKAGEYSGIQELDFDRQLHELDLKKNELEEKELQLKAADKLFTELVDKYQRLHSDLEQRKNEILSKARTDAKKLMADTNRMIENTIRKIRESQAEKAITKEARKDLEIFSESLKTPQGDNPTPVSLEDPEETIPMKVAGLPKTGDFVRVEGHTGIGELIETDGYQAVVAIGNIRFKTRLTNLEKLNAKQAKSLLQQRVKIKLGFDINQKAAEFNPNLDIKGYRAEEAITELRRFIDDALLLGARELKVTHGKGDGILREAVRQTLKGIAQVKTMRDEHPDRGGAGATLIEL